MCLISSCSVDKSISELVDFLNSWSRATTGRRGSSRPTWHTTSRHAATWHTTSRHAATWHTTWGSTSCSLVEVLNDGVADLLDLLLLLLVHHLLDVLLGQAALVVGDRDLVLLSS